jgi:methionine salvage enolase-phosphatase E1
MKAVKGAIASTGYQSNNLSVTIQPDVIALVVKPANTLSKAVSNVSTVGG